MYILLMAWCTYTSYQWSGVHVHLTNGVVYMYILLMAWWTCTSYSWSGVDVHHGISEM